MSGLEGLGALVGIFVVIIIIVGAWSLFYFIPVRMWVEAWFSGVKVGLGTLIGMRLRKVNQAPGGSSGTRSRHDRAGSGPASPRRGRRFHDLPLRSVRL